MNSMDSMIDQMPSCSRIDENKEVVSSPSSSSQIIQEIPERLWTVENRVETTVYRRFFSFLFFASFIGNVLSTARCFTTEKGISIDGSEYRRIRNSDLRECAMECRSDGSCLAFEWRADSMTCFLKARSLSGEMMRRDNTVAGFCIDDEDEARDRFLDHEITGPLVTSAENIEAEKCREFCMEAPESTVYSWRPDDMEDDEADTGKCSCMESIRGLHLSYNSFSGFFQSKPSSTQHKRLKFRV